MTERQLSRAIVQPGTVELPHTGKLLAFLEDPEAKAPMPTFMELHGWRGNNPEGNPLWPVHLCGLT